MSVQKRMTNEEFVKKLLEFRPNLIPLETYRGVDAKLKFHCSVCGDDFYTTPYVALQKTNGNGCRECNGTKQKTHNEYVKDLHDRHINITPIEQYRTCNKNILHQCNVCNYTWSARPSNILSGYGCPVCKNKAVLRGYNDLWTTHPNVASWLANSDEGYKYTSGSGKRVTFKCPDCGSERQQVIRDVARYGCSCNKCSDGISFPMKFTMSVLEQLQIPFKIEVKFEWCNFYNPYKQKYTYGIYDIVFTHDNQNYIIEVDGIFHYRDNHLSKQSHEESTFIDSQKDRLALQNGYKMIRIPALQSNLEYMRQSILSSPLSDMYDLSMVNWKDCALYAASSLVLECAKLWNVYHRAKYVAEHVHRRQETVVRYLNQAAKLGLCDYDGTKERVKSALRTVAIRKTPCKNL